MIVRTIVRSELPKEAAKEFVKLAKEAISRQGQFRVVLTGGGLGIELLKALSELVIDWPRITVVFSDERFVSHESADRNEHQALAACPQLKNATFLRYPSASGSLDEAAKEFNSRIEGEFGPLVTSQPTFDLVILGMGPDGHVASLFPGRLHSKQWIVSEDASPKPPAQRLSLSYQALNSAQLVWFLVAGSEKADAARNAIKSLDLPAGRVRGKLETIWWLDQEVSDAL